MKYNKNKNVNIILDPITITFLHDGRKFLDSIIATSIKAGICSDACKFISCQCANESYLIQDVDFDQSYSPVAHDDSSRINIASVAMHIITSKILNVSNDFQNRNVLIHKRVCVIPPLYYLDLLKNDTPIFLSIDITVNFVFSA